MRSQLARVVSRARLLFPFVALVAASLAEVAGRRW